MKHYGPRLTMARVFNFPSLPLLMIVEVAPFTPQVPCATMSRTSFGARELSVSFTSDYRGSSYSAPSVVVEKRTSLGMSLPQVEVITTSSPKHPPNY